MMSLLVAGSTSTGGGDRRGSRRGSTLSPAVAGEKPEERYVWLRFAAFHSSPALLRSSPESEGQNEARTLRNDKTADPLVKKTPAEPASIDGAAASAVDAPGLRH